MPETKKKGLENKKVLVVDDVELNQFLVRHVLESWGMLVDLASNGMEAVESVRNKTYDLVLMDIHMPEMDGVQATKAIRQMPETEKAGLPIIALTANTSREDLDRYKDAGIDFCLSKPLDEPKLFAITCQYVLERSNGRHTAGAAVEKTEPLYNWKLVLEIAGGDLVFLKKMATLFTETMPQSVAIMKNSFREKDYDALGKIAHKMKSTIDSMAVVSVKNEIRLIEQGCRTKEGLEQLEPIVQKVVSVMEECVEEVKKEFQL